MLVVISDLHLQDTARSGPGCSGDANVRPAAFEYLWQQIDALAERAGATGPLTLVLNGDIFEILRSELWLVRNQRPYNFTGPLDLAEVRTAADIGEAILVENAAAIAALRGRRPVRFVFVYGNHDRLLRHDGMAGVRQGIAAALGGDVRFVDELIDERYRALVQHGHELDWTGSEYQHVRAYHGTDGLAEGEVPEGRDPGRRMLAPLGDWVALDIGTRLPHLAWTLLTEPEPAWSELSPEVRADLHTRLVHLDDLRPPGEVLRWLARPGDRRHLSELAGKAESEAIEHFLGTLLNELITGAMPLIEPWLEAHGRPLFDRLALGAVGLLGSSKYTSGTLPSLMERIQSYLSGQDKPWMVLQRTAAFRGGGHAHYVSGHTHEPGVHPLRDTQSLSSGPGPTDGPGAWYLNTGTWRKTILRSPADPDAYGSVKQVAFAVLYDEDETQHQTGTRGTSFDLWQGASQRF